MSIPTTKSCRSVRVTGRPRRFASPPVFFLGRRAAAEVAFFFVDPQDLFDLGGECRIDVTEFFRYVLMYRAFAYAVALSRRPDRAAVRDDVFREFFAPVF